jgi:hypothetical protein
MAVNEMEVLTASVGQEITIAGEKITVKPYSWANTIKMARPLSVVLNGLFANYEALGKLLKDTKKENLVNQFVKLSGFVCELENAEELIDGLTEMMAVAAGRDKDFVADLLADDALTLGRTVYEVNKAFFTKRLEPMLMKIETPKEKPKK